MRSLFADALPTRIIERGSKGAFTDPLWTQTARDFAHQWSGKGLNEELVDVDRLREHWTGSNINLLSTSLLQAAWLADSK